MNHTLQEKANSTKAKLKSKLKRTKAPLKITDDTISEHRKVVLAKGKKFKYPLQFSRKRILTATIILLILGLLTSSVYIYIGLYHKQKTTDFYYNVARALPLPVAKVEGEFVGYGDYLKRLRADLHYFNRQHGVNDSKELAYHKRNELNQAERAAYVRRVASLRGVDVSNNEVEQEISSKMKAESNTKDILANTLQNYYGWTIDDYKQVIKEQLLEQKVAFFIDNEAKAKVKKIDNLIKNDKDFNELIDNFSQSISKKADKNIAAKLSDNDPTGIVNVVRKLKVGETSQITKMPRFRDGNYYYFIAKLISKNDEQVNYSLIMVRADKLDKDFKALGKRGQIKEYIKVPSSSEFGS